MGDIVIKAVTRRIGKKSKSPDKRPARQRYWITRKLEERKVGNLMKYCGMSKQQAYNFWHNGNIEKNGLGRRMGRVKDGYLKKTA